MTDQAATIVLEEIRPENYLAYSVPGGGGRTDVALRDGRFLTVVHADGSAVHFQELLEYLKDKRLQMALRRIEQLAAVAERERCAKLCDQTFEELDKEFSPEGCTDSARVAAERIRALK